MSSWVSWSELECMFLICELVNLCTEYSVWRAWRNHIKWGDNRVSSKVTTYFPSWNSSGGSQML
jgi:hypothetical protein